MEPRSWKWIQAAVIAAAMLIGIGAAVWYQNRPVDDRLPVPAPMPTRRTVFVPTNPDVLPPAAPRAIGAVTAPPAASGADPAVPAPLPLGGASSSGQRTTVDPMTHLQVAPSRVSSPSAVSSPVSPVSPAVPSAFGAPPAASPSAFPSGSSIPSAFPSAPSASPSSSSQVSPFVGAPPTVGGTSVPGSSAPSATPAF